MQTLIVYRGKDNPVEDDLVYYDGDKRKYLPFDFTGVTRMALTFLEPGEQGLPALTFDTATIPGCIDWSNNGHVQFFLSEYSIPVGIYNTRLVTYSDQTPNGEVVIDGDAINGRQLSFEVRGDSPDGIPPPSIPTGGIILTRVAGETLSALRVVYERNGQVFLLDPGTRLSPVDQMLGVTLTAGEAGAQIAIRAEGTLDDAGWAWTEGLVFVGPDGTLTQTYPAVGWEIVVGASPSSQRINLNFDEPVFLA